VRKWSARDWVAVTLAGCVALPFLAFSAVQIVLSFHGPDAFAQANEIERGKEIVGLLEFLAGGLIGWLAGTRLNGHKNQKQNEEEEEP